MKIAATYSHLNGHEWLLVHKENTWREVEAIVAGIPAVIHLAKVSNENPNARPLRISPKELSETFKAVFSSCGWSESRMNYWVTDDYRLMRRTIPLVPEMQKLEIERAGKRPIQASKRMDFVKNRVAVEIQIGNPGFIAHDLFVKHLAFYANGGIDVGIEILPMKSMQECLKSGTGYYEAALFDLARQDRGVPAVPLVLAGIEP